jgi:hypothetical protein
MTFSIVTWLNIVLLMSMPSYFVQMRFSFVFFGIDAHTYLRKIILVASLHAIITSSFIFIVPSSFFPPLSITFWFFLYLTIFRKLPLSERIGSGILSLVMGIVIEVSSGLIWLQYYTQEQILSNPLLCIIYLWPFYMVIVILTLIMQQKHIHPGKQIRKYLTNKRGKPMLYLVLLLVIQIILIIFLIPVGSIKDNAATFLLGRPSK